MELIQFTQENCRELEKYTSQKIYRGFHYDRFLSDKADAHLLVKDHENVLARASIWWNEVPILPNEKLCAVGHFEAENNSSAKYLLEKVTQISKSENCTLLLGPMDGNTWRKYRYITWSDGSLPFFLERQNPQAYPDYFMQAGFSAYKKYVSTLDTDLTTLDHRFEKIHTSFTNKGIKIRNFSNRNFKKDLKSIFEVSIRSFTHNPLFMPISEEEFTREYSVFEGKVVEPLVLLAEDHQKVVGFIFAFPDPLSAKEGFRPKTTVFKTIAVVPERRYAGLGALLISHIRKNASQLGFQKAIYAYMFESNKSMNIAKKNHTKRIREYTLFSKKVL